MKNVIPKGFCTYFPFLFYFKVNVPSSYYINYRTHEACYSAMFLYIFSIFVLLFKGQCTFIKIKKLENA